MTADELLQDGLSVMRLDLSGTMVTKLLGYVALLAKWNRTYNLTAIRKEKDMVIQHLLDSLSVLQALPGKSHLASPGGSELSGQGWADVGSGAGLPGIPLAIARPDVGMTLIEAVEKKSAFQRQAKIELGLSNITVHCGRAEDMSGRLFGSVISRAFADLGEFVRLAGHLLAPNGRLYAMKGVAPEDEMNRLPSGWTVLDCRKLSVPGLDAQRHLIILEKA